MAKKSYQGKFHPSRPEKWIGDIYYRSSIEFRYFRKLEENPAVIGLASEEIVVPYISPVDGKPHRYFVDLWIKTKQKDGSIKTFIAEIKPEVETQPPKKLKYITENYKRRVITYAINQAKWETARKYASKRGWHFIILTENML